jgi:rod shape-determining protein MreD
MSYWKNYFIRGFWLLTIVLATFIFAMMLSIMYLPNTIKWLMPNWVVLVLIYWMIFMPELIGLNFIFILSMMLDLLMNNLLGLTSICLMPVAFFAERICYRFRSFNLPQQFLTITVLVAINNLIRLWLQMYIKHPTNDIHYWLTIISSVIAWPFVCGSLNLLRKTIRLC